jgi:hypothetical protein
MWLLLEILRKLAILTLLTLLFNLIKFTDKRSQIDRSWELRVNEETAEKESIVETSYILQDSNESVNLSFISVILLIKFEILVEVETLTWSLIDITVEVLTWWFWEEGYFLGLTEDTQGTIV